MTKDTKNGSKLYFKILKTWENWESTRITSIPFPFLRTSFPIPSGQIPVPATQIPFSQSKNRSIPVPIFPFQDPLRQEDRVYSDNSKDALLKMLSASKFIVFVGKFNYISICSFAYLVLYYDFFLHIWDGITSNQLLAY
jgi:hypothetical protein